MANDRNSVHGPVCNISLKRYISSPSLKTNL